MQNQSPLNKVVFVQKVVAFTKVAKLKKLDSLKGLFQLAYVNNSWNDTIKNYSFHLFEDQVCDVESTNSLEDVCLRVIKSGVIWFLEVLLSSKTLLNRIVDLPLLICKNKLSSNVTMMQVVLENILKAGGKTMLKSQLSSTTEMGWNSLMLATMHCAPVEVMKLMFEKIVEVGGTELLKSQLTTVSNMCMSCLMIGCWYSSSPEALKLIFETIVEVGGKDLLRRELASRNVDGWTPVMFGCGYSEFPEVPKLILQQIFELGGTDSLKEHLTARSTWGATTFMIVCHCSPPPEVAKFLAVVVFDLDLFKKQYLEFDDGDKAKLQEKTGIKDASWVPDAKTIAQVKKKLQGNKN